MMTEDFAQTHGIDPETQGRAGAQESAHERFLRLREQPEWTQPLGATTWAEVAQAYRDANPTSAHHETQEIAYVFGYMEFSGPEAITPQALSIGHDVLRAMKGELAVDAQTNQ